MQPQKHKLLLPHTISKQWLYVKIQTVNSTLEMEVSSYIQKPSTYLLHFTALTQIPEHITTPVKT